MPTHDSSQLTENPIVDANILATASDNLVYKKNGSYFEGRYHIHEDGTMMAGVGQVGVDHEIDEDKILIVKKYLIEIIQSENGTIVLDPPQPTDGYSLNDTVNLTAIPNDGYVFGEWQAPILPESISSPTVFFIIESTFLSDIEIGGSFINETELQITELEVRERVADYFYKLWFDENPFELTEEQILSIQTTIDDQGKKVSGRTEQDQLVFYKKDRNTLENTTDFQQGVFENIVQNVYLNNLLSSDSFESLFSFHISGPVSEENINVKNYIIKYTYGANVYNVNVAKEVIASSGESKGFINIVNLSQITKPKFDTTKIDPEKAKKILDTDIFELLPNQLTRQDEIDKFFIDFNSLVGNPPEFTDSDEDGILEHITMEEYNLDEQSRVSYQDQFNAYITRLNEQVDPAGINSGKTLETMRNTLNQYLGDVDHITQIIGDDRPEYKNKLNGFLKIRKPNQAIILRNPTGDALEFENYHDTGFTITMWVRFIGKAGRGTLFNYGNPTNEEKFGFRLETITKKIGTSHYRMVRLVVADIDETDTISDTSNTNYTAEGLPITRIFDSHFGIPGQTRSNTAYVGNGSDTQEILGWWTGGAPVYDVSPDNTFFNHTQIPTDDLNEWFFICATYNPNVDEYSSIRDFRENRGGNTLFWQNHIMPGHESVTSNDTTVPYSGYGAKCKVEVISRSELLRARGYKVENGTLNASDVILPPPPPSPPPSDEPPTGSPPIADFDTTAPIVDSTFII